MSRARSTEEENMETPSECEMALVDFDMRVMCILTEHPGIHFSEAEKLAREEVREELAEGGSQCGRHWKSQSAKNRKTKQ